MRHTLQPPHRRPLLQAWFRRLLGERRTERVGGRRASDLEPNRGWRPALAIALGVAFLDWSVKAWIASWLPLGSLVVVWEDRVALFHLRNEEMVLGLWGNLPLEGRQLIALMGGILCFFIFFQLVGKGHRLSQRQRPWLWACVGLACGGMLGNLGERALHWGVTDYLSFGWGTLWLPPGNLADIAILSSFVLTIPVALFELQGRAQRRGEAARTAAGLAAPGA